LDSIPRLASSTFSEGTDVSEILGIQKWEAPEETTGCPRIQGSGKKFPSFIQKTDQERVQNINAATLQAALDEAFEATIKKDGSSITVFRVDPTSPYYPEAVKMYAKKMTFWQKLVDKVKFLFSNKPYEPIYGICSRNLLLSLKGESNFHRVVDKYSLFAKLDEMAYYSNGSYALQGELVAPTIQGNYERVNDVEFHLFDIFDIDLQKYVFPMVRFYEAEESNIPHATVLARGKLRDIIGYKEGDDIVQKCLEYAEGPGDNPGVKREGVVFKAMGRDFSFKAVSNSYLLATGK
jgi:RNA ligase (TIGR02306 family)